MEGKIGMLQQKNTLYKRYVSTRQIIRLMSKRGIKGLMFAIISRLTTWYQDLWEKVSNLSQSTVTQQKFMVGSMAHT